ncbi:MAG: tRNA (adenosine(37)-N6)-threonylcarbamoyltransferase complex transferase subunit TsaD [Bacteroidia bacterium]|nr:tRNA (adenosine(37)-N6)-threonylcarbamoyltransferase complex transferase subunit TsaD [Bacteroidia bacterium]
MKENPLILSIESSCDETSAAVLEGEKVLSNIISSQVQHEEYGGVIPELASRLHQQHILKVVNKSLKVASKELNELDAIAVTDGPGLMGSLLVGNSFAKALSYGLGVPLIGVHHMKAHVLANFLTDNPPKFPFMCLTVSGGHTQLVYVKDYVDMEIIGETIDDAAGEAFDKAAKLMGLPYPGGPQVDKLASKGDPIAFGFPEPEVGKYEFSFSGLKTSLLYKLRDGLKKDENFIETHKNDIAASYQKKIVDILLKKLGQAAKDYKVQDLAIAGGVSANSELRRRLIEFCETNGYTAHIPPFEFCTDNAGMIGFLAYKKFLKNDFLAINSVPFTRGGF